MAVGTSLGRIAAPVFNIFIKLVALLPVTNGM